MEKKLCEMTSSEIWTQLTEVQKRELADMHRADSVTNDVEDVIENKHLNLPQDEREALVNDVVNAYVYDGDCDSNLSYWDNIDNLIDRFLEKEVVA